MTQAAAYGLRVSGIAPTPWLSVAGAEGWPVIKVVRKANAILSPPRVDLTAMTVTAPEHAGVDVVVHPLLAHAGLAHARADGADALHAGALVGADGAWLVAGRKEAGKSTLMEAAGRAGVDVLTDDVAIVRGGSVLAGPRCVDLRHAPPTGGDVVRHGERWRVTQRPAGAASVIAAGVVFPVWGGSLGVRRLRPADVVQRLNAMRDADHYPAEPMTLLELASLPAYELSRPRDLAGVDASVATLTELISA